MQVRPARTVEEYHRTICAIEEAFRLPFPELYKDTANMNTTIGVFNSSDTIGGLVYRLANDGFSAFVRFIGVVPEFTGMGIGRRLLTKFEDESRKKGVSLWILNAKSESGLYTNSGYVRSLHPILKKNTFYKVSACNR